MKRPFLIFIAICLFVHSLSAQNNVKQQPQPHRSLAASLFSDSNTLSRSDYLAALEKVFQAFNKAPVVTASFEAINNISNHLKEDDNAISIIKERLSPVDKSLNLRNLQMFSVLLEQLNEDTREYNKVLDGYADKLDTLKKEIRDLRKDTLIRVVFQDSALKASFKPELLDLHAKFIMADSLIRSNTTVLNNLKAHASTNIITIEELKFQADALLKAVGTQAFSKEKKYLWEPRSGNPVVARGFKKSVEEEKQITQYYFSNTRGQRYWLFITGVIFFFWIFYNFRSLRRLDKLSAIATFNFKYIHPFPIVASFIFVLDIAPLFDLNAPAIYIETIGFLLMFTLTVFLWRRIPRSLFYFWGLFIALFLLSSFSRLLGLPFYLQRYWTLIINAAAFVVGALGILRYKKQWLQYKFVYFSASLYIFFNFLAVICNAFGRVTLTQIFTATAIYSFIQAIGLFVFMNLVTEAFLLQIQASRMRKHYPEKFDFTAIEKGIKRFVIVLAAIIWLIVFTTNLNIYEALTDYVGNYLSTPRELGSFSFTLKGLILFLAIIWAANFLQKYIAYFFGDIGDEAAFDNKGQRSRLLITRLILLTVGFLLAVAASGLPIDKITVVLGALGVGIGLGLQSIVNNFVSGIILIFDRPLRIGDVVEIGDKKGRVKEIGVRSSTLLTTEGAEVIIPNGDVLSHNIVNWTLSNNNIRMDLDFKIEKPFDASLVKSTIEETMKATSNILVNKEPEIFISNVSATAAEVRVFFWCKDVTKTEYIHNTLFAAIQTKLEEKGIKYSY